MRRSLVTGYWLLIAVLCASCAPTSTSDPPPGFDVRFHPDGPLYVGDQISLEILTPADFDPTGRSVTVSLDDQSLGQAGFAPFGVGERMQATLWWAWDTKGLEPASYTLTFTLSPESQTWQETVRLRPQNGIPPPEPEAHWASVECDCCLVYYITGTAAERDLPQLLEITDEQAEAVESQMGAEFSEVTTITFLPRLLGHGGFAGEGIHLSYVDENYAGSTTELVLHHEMVHILDTRLGGDLRPTILVEGLAVYLSGGHFKPEPLVPRAAALLDLGWYIPLEKLADDFYPQQHEIGYLQAGALVAYMVQTYGWEAFDAFYRDIHPDSSGSQTRAIDAALQKHFSLSLAQLEADFLTFLKTQTTDDAVRSDLRLTVQFYDTVRRYQQMLDPSAYFLTAWLPDSATMRERGMVADYLRRPRGLSNWLIESLLMNANDELLNGQYEQAEKTLETTNEILEVIDFFSSP